MIVFALLLALLVIGTPLAFAVLAAAMLFVIDSPFPFSLVAQRTFAGIDSFALLAIPLFVLAGELMNTSGITERIIRVANATVGHFRAGLAHVNVWSSVIFAGLSGSAVADTSALGRVFIPNMEREGYPRDFAAALTAASSVIGPVIPPSIPVILYALIATGVSVPALFLAGVIPGLALAGSLSLYLRFAAPIYVPGRPRLPLREQARALAAGIVPLLMPIFVVGSIVFGIVTPTEAAAFAVFYALAAGLFILRTLSWSALPGIFVRSMRDSSVILIIIAVVSLANWLLTRERVPQTIAQIVLDTTSNPIVFLLAVNMLLLVAGLILEGTAAMLVLVPILHPLALQFGIDPTHFGIVVILNLMIGLITPPMGLCLFVADSISNVGLLALSKRILPLFLVEVAVLAAVTYIPSLSTWLPSLFGF